MKLLLRNLPLCKPPLLVLLGAALAVVAACSSPSGPVAGEPGSQRITPTVAAVDTPTPTPAPTAQTTLPAITPTATPAARTLSPTPTPEPARLAPAATPTAAVNAVAPPTPEPTLTPQEPPTPIDDPNDLYDPEDRLDGPPGAAGGLDPRQLVSGRTCGTGPVLSALPIDLDNLTNINPLGNLEPPSHTFPTSHMYFGLKPVQGADGEGPFGDGQTFPPHAVFAVADSRIASLIVATLTTSRSGREQTFVEYSLTLAVCDGLQVTYGHVGPVSDRIQAAVADFPGGNCDNYSTGGQAIESCRYPLGLELAAGEQIGFNSGRGAALDVGAYDATSQNVDFQHPELYSPEANGSVCLLDLYGDDQRSAMARLLGDNSHLRTAAPAGSICGVLNFTVPGTLQGNWFSQLGSFSQEDRNIAFVFDEVRPELPIISIGFVPGIPSQPFSFEPRDEGTVNRLFTDVEAGGGVFCYQDFQDHWGNPGPAAHLLIEVPEAGQLLVRAVDGASCGPPQSEQIGADATQFVR